MRSYNDVPIDSMHEPHSRVKRRSKQYASEDSPLKPSRHISATPKSSLRELEESVETTTALPTSEDSSRFQSSSHPTPNSHDPTPEDSQISSSSSSNMPARSINLPYPGLSFGSRKQSRKVESRPPESYPEAQPPTNHMQPPTPATPRSGPHRKGPPVRGRPLIFAAMAANPQVAEIVDDISALAQEETVEQIPDEGVPSSFNDQAPTKEPYPSPKSPDVELPQPRQVPNQPELEPPRRRRKLAKVNRAISRKEGVATHGEADSSRAKDTSAHHSVGPSQNLLAGHRHHDDRPRTPVNLAQELTSLGSPIQLQEETREGMHHRRSRSDDYAKLLKRNRDKVKALTEKQLEKLGRRNSNDHAYEQEVKPIAQPLPFPATRPLPAPPTQLPTPPSRSPVPHGPDPSAPSHPQAPPTPPAEDFAYTRTRCQTYPLERSSSQVGERLRSDHFDEELQAPPPPPTYYPILEHVNEPVLLANILCYLSYFEWCTLAVVSKEIRTVMYTRRELTELILERYLRTVGYDRWSWKHRDPLLLTLDVRTHFYLFGQFHTHYLSRI